MERTSPNTSHQAPGRRHCYLVRVAIPLGFFLILTASAACAEEFKAKVVGIVDGDTLDVLKDNKEERIRLDGIDAPEKTQAFGQEARKYTASLCMDKLVSVNTVKKDRYGRSIGIVTLPDGRVLNKELVRSGLAWWYRKYAQENKELQELELEALQNHRGLWRDKNPVAPWDFRHPEKKPAKSIPNENTEPENPNGSDEKSEASPPSISATEKRTGPTFQVQVKPEAQALQGRAEEKDGNSGLNLRGRAEDKSGVMRIVQYKPKSFTPYNPSASYMPATNQPALASHADTRRLQASATSNHAPVRTNPGPETAPERTLETENAPVRQTNETAPRGPVDSGPPVHLALTSNQAPVRTLDESAPLRTIRESPGSPVRPLLSQQIEARPSFTQTPLLEDKSELETKLNSKVSGRLRKPPERKQKPREPETRSQTNTQELDERTETLLWDKWYAQVNDLLCSELARTMKEQGYPAGKNRIHVSISKEHTVQASLIQGTNEKFDRAILDAYQALNGNKKLEFPRGTKRTIVDYESAHDQEIAASTSSYETQSVQGDRELIQR